MKPRIVIPSKDRVEDCRHAITLFRNPLVVVREDQRAQYEPLGVELLTHPMNVAGIGPLKNWILDNVPDECVFLVDDDVINVRSPVGHPTKSHNITDPQTIEEIIGNAAEMAIGAGTPVFGFDQSGADTRKFRAQDPIGLSGWVGAAMGIIGRSVRYDPNLRIRADIDFCLQTQLKHRIILMDRRFSFVHRPRFTYKGGNASTRSQERNDQELAYLQQKWGKHLTVKLAETTVRLVVNVNRRSA